MHYRVLLSMMSLKLRTSFELVALQDYLLD